MEKVHSLLSQICKADNKRSACLWYAQTHIVGTIVESPLNDKHSMYFYHNNKILLIKVARGV